jgi:glycosyltransferase involved in cell wall biosynthesis
VRDFQPEVLYGHCSDLNSVLFLRRMRQALGLPLILHFMDDWAETKYREGWIAKLLHPRFQAEFRELVRSADVTIAICQEMAEEYEKRYQRPVLWFPMPVELGAYLAAARTRWTAGRPFRLRYGGRVGWAIHESLADLAGVVHVLRQGGTDVALDIVTFQADEVPAACLALTGVAVQVPGPLAELPRLQAEADVLVVCYDFDQESFRQARYSMPSKLADCMASGTPILVYGPAGLPVVEYARRDGWGKVVDRRDPLALQAAMRELMGSAVLREQLGRNAQRLAVERHDATTVSMSLRAVLRGAVDRANGAIV